MKRTLLALFAVAFCATATSGYAQDLPRTITLVVPFAAGGVTDQVARLIASKVSNNTARNVVVENRPGGGGQIAAGAVKQSRPDGSTLLIGDIGTHAINASLYSKLSYDPVKDFVPITELVEMAHVLVVSPESSFKTMSDVIAFAHANPGRLTYASVGVGSGAHLLGEMMKSDYKMEIVHAPYRGSSQIVPDLMANRVGMFFGAVGSMSPLISEGKLRGLLVTDQHRSPLLPQIPTASEAGAPSLDLKVWFGVLAPAGTPSALVDRLNMEFVKAANQPDAKQRLTEWGANVIANSPAEFAKVIASDTVRLGKVVRAAGAHVN
jgi:tripartite-type tricarboxylate transporter receptor subunit TctC